MNKILSIIILFWFIINQSSANFTNDWKTKNLESRNEGTPAVVDNTVYTYNFPKNFKVLESNLVINDRPWSPGLVYNNFLFDKILKKLWKEKTKELFDKQIIKIIWKYNINASEFDKVSYEKLDLVKYEKKEEVYTINEINHNRNANEEDFIKKYWKFFEENFLIEVNWNKKLKMNIEVLKDWNFCNYNRQEPDEKKAKLCLYDCSLLPIDFTVNYQIFDKNNKEKSKTESKKLPIKYKFVKEDWITFYRPYLELDIDFSNIMKEWDLLKLNMTYTRYNHGY